MASSKVSHRPRALKRGASCGQPHQITVVHECLALAAGAIGEAVGIFESEHSGTQRVRALRLLRNAQSIVECEMGGAL